MKLVGHIYYLFISGYFATVPALLIGVVISEFNEPIGLTVASVIFLRIFSILIIARGERWFK